jgi:hypothetical protein
MDASLEEPVTVHKVADGLMPVNSDEFFAAKVDINDATRPTVHFLAPSEQDEISGGAPGHQPVASAPAGENLCEGMNPDLPNVDCVIDGTHQAGEQAAANITEGHNGDLETMAVPIDAKITLQG